MKRAVLLLIFACAVALWMSGCGSSEAAPPAQVVSVQLTPLSSTTIVHAQTLEFNATVANDSGNAGVTWVVTGTSCTGDGCGTMSYTESLHAHYTAPASPTGMLTVSVTATSVKDTTKSASTTVTVWPHLTITTTSLPDGARGIAYNATVQSSGGMPALHWSVAVGSLPAGLTLNPNTGVILGTPTAVETQAFTVEVTDAANPAQVAEQALSITTVEPPLTIITTWLPDGGVGSSYNQALKTVSGTPPFTWSVTTGSLPSQLSLDPVTGVISGMPDTAGTVDFTVHVVDSSDPQQMDEQALSLRILGTGSSNAELAGDYVFMLSGYSLGGFTTVVGRFHADGTGNVSEGTADLNEGGVAGTDSFTGTYVLNFDHRGTMTINTSGGPRTFAFVTRDCGWIDATCPGGAMIEFDGNGWMSGEFTKQAPIAFNNGTLTGSFAFGASGLNGLGMRFAEVGRIQFNGAGGVSGGSVDFNNDGVHGSATLTGTYSVASNGRVAMTTSSNLGETSHLVLYAATDNDGFLLSTDGPPMPSYAGKGYKQSGTFNNAGLLGPAVNLGVGRCPFNPNGSKATAGLLDFNGAGGVDVSYDENLCGVIGSNSNSDSYAVDANGRAVLGANTAVLYLVEGRRGFYIGTTDSVEYGLLEPQSGAPFSSDPLWGPPYGYGVVPPVRTQGLAQVGVANTTNGAVAATSDLNLQGVTSTVSFNDTYTASPNGRVTTGSGDSIWYVVNESRAFSINTHAGHIDPEATIMNVVFFVW